MQERIPVGLSMPKTFITRIDSERGDIPRSRYVLRLIETGIIGKGKEKGEGKEKENLLSQTAQKVGPIEQPAIVEPKPPIVKRSDSDDV